MLLGASGEALTALAAADGQPAYRGKQLADGVKNGARSLADIANVSRRCGRPQNRAKALQPAMQWMAVV